jgi:hypothetical protein
MARWTFPPVDDGRSPAKGDPAPLVVAIAAQVEPSQAVHCPLQPGHPPFRRRPQAGGSHILDVPLDRIPIRRLLRIVDAFFQLGQLAAEVATVLVMHRGRERSIACQPLGAVCSQQLVDLETSLSPALDPALVDQPQQGLQPNASGLFRRLPVKAAAKDGKPPDGHPLRVCEQLPRGVEHGAQAPLPVRYVAGVRLQEIEALFDPGGDLVRLKDADPGCGQLDAQGHSLDQRADPRHRHQILR